MRRRIASAPMWGFSRASRPSCRAAAAFNGVITRSKQSQTLQRMKDAIRDAKNNVPRWSGHSDDFVQDKSELVGVMPTDKNYVTIDFIPESQEQIDALIDEYGCDGLRIDMSINKNGKYVVTSAPKKREPYVYKRSQPSYPLKKRYVVAKYLETFEAADMIVVYQHNGGKDTADKFAQELNASEGIRVIKLLKNSLAGVAMLQSKDKNLNMLANLMNGPISLVTVQCEDADLVTNLKKILAGQDKKKNICFYGAKVQDSLLDHEDIEMLSKIGSTLDLRSQLIQTIAQPAHNLIRALSTPQTNLVKTLDFKVSQESEKLE